jgi:hypothetical protein
MIPGSARSLSSGAHPRDPLGLPRTDVDPYGLGLFGGQVPEAHFGVDDAVTTTLLLFDGVGGGFGRGLPAV